MQLLGSIVKSYSKIIFSESLIFHLFLQYIQLTELRKTRVTNMSKWWLLYALWPLTKIGSKATMTIFRYTIVKFTSLKSEIRRFQKGSREPPWIPKHLPRTPGILRDLPRTPKETPDVI